MSLRRDRPGAGRGPRRRRRDGRHRPPARSGRHDLAHAVRRPRHDRDHGDLLPGRRAAAALRQSLRRDARRADADRLVDAGAAGDQLPGPGLAAARGSSSGRSREIIAEAPGRRAERCSTRPRPSASQGRRSAETQARDGPRADADERERSVAADGREGGRSRTRARSIADARKDADKLRADASDEIASEREAEQRERTARQARRAGGRHRRAGCWRLPDSRRDRRASSTVCAKAIDDLPGAERARDRRRTRQPPIDVVAARTLAPRREASAGRGKALAAARSARDAHDRCRDRSRPDRRARAAMRRMPSCATAGAPISSASPSELTAMTRPDADADAAGSPRRDARRASRPSRPRVEQVGRVEHVGDGIAVRLRPAATRGSTSCCASRAASSASP